MLEKFFNLKENQTNIRTEVMAGMTTFLTMAYILTVNPNILSAAGMDKGAVFTATAAAAAIGTLVMAFWAKLPFALAPGMGLNAFFAYTVCIGMGHSWQFALTAVFLEGIIFILLTVFNIREMIVNAIPINLKHAISVGIGILIAFIGLKSAGVIVANPVTFVSLGDLSAIKNNPSPLLALITIVLIGALLTYKVRGSILIGILICTIVGIPLGATILPIEFNFKPPSISPIFFQFEWKEVLSADMFFVVFTFLFMDIFDSIGTLIGVSSKSGMLDKNGRIPNVKKALFADSIGTTAGAILGTSTVTVYVESASGVAEGGRTGLTALTTAILFLLSLFLSPLFLMIPPAATAAALVVVGAMMITPIKNIQWENLAETIPVFLAIIMMPLTFSIAEGIVFGILSYVFLKITTKQHKEVSPLMYVLALLFVLKIWL